MNAERLRSEIERMGNMPGLDGCALVEIEAGMVWHAAGHIEDVQFVAEAASDYWRLYRRLNQHFASLGDLRACVMLHQQGRITLLPCGSGMLLVTLSRQTAEVDWNAWQLQTRKLASMVDEL